MSRNLARILVALGVCFAGESFAQGQTAVPFLIIPTSVEANGMGGAAASLITNDAISTIWNPAQLGFLGLNGSALSLSTYAPKTMWLPGSMAGGYGLTASALSAGLQLNDYMKLPATVSLGVGYSSLYLDLGEFKTIVPGTPTVTSQFHAYEKADNIAFGLGVDYLVKFSIGFNFKSIQSNLGPTVPTQPGGPLVTKTPAHDFGMLLQIPVVDIISHFREKPVEFNDVVSPLLDLTFGYASRNVGGEISYAGQSDPLPRQGVLGWNFEAGLKSHVDDLPWRLLTFTWAREATDVLVSTTTSEKVIAPGDTVYTNKFSYVDGLGGIRPVGNLILGKGYGTVDLMKGWQVDLAECLYVREGSYTGVGGVSYTTHGGSFALNGFLKLIASLKIWDPKYGWGAFFLNHLDVQYSTSTYTSSPNGLLNGTKFSSINIVFR